MKKLGITAVLVLLLAVTLGPAGAGAAADHQLTVVNASRDTVTVALIWSGGGVEPIKLAAGETHEGVVPAAIDSVKVTANGHCRQATQTFNPQRVNRATVDCKGDTYAIQLAMTKPAY